MVFTHQGAHFDAISTEKDIFTFPFLERQFSKRLVFTVFFAFAHVKQIRHAQTTRL
jgi:hypothetical protein